MTKKSVVILIVATVLVGGAILISPQVVEKQQQMQLERERDELEQRRRDLEQERKEIWRRIWEIEQEREWGLKGVSCFPCEDQLEWWDLVYRHEQEINELYERQGGHPDGADGLRGALADMSRAWQGLYESAKQMEEQRRQDPEQEQSELEQRRRRTGQELWQSWSERRLQAIEQRRKIEKELWQGWSEQRLQALEWERDELNQRWGDLEQERNEIKQRIQEISWNLALTKDTLFNIHLEVGCPRCYDRTEWGSLVYRHEQEIKELYWRQGGHPSGAGALKELMWHARHAWWKLYEPRKRTEEQWERQKLEQ